MWRLGMWWCRRWQKQRSGNRLYGFLGVSWSAPPRHGEIVMMLVGAILLMVQKSGDHQLIWYISHYLHGFYTSKRWWSPDFWTINSMSWLGCHSKQRDWVPKFYIFNWRVGDFFSPGMSWWLPCQKTTAMAWLSNPRLNKMSRASILCKMSWNSFILKTSNMWNIFFTSSASRINIIFAENSYSIAGSQMLLVNFHSALPYNVSQAHGSVAHQSFHLAWYQRNSRDWAWKNPWENQPDNCRWAMKKHLVV